MINNEKVTIQLNPKDKTLSNPPVKFCKSKNGRPSSDSFVFRVAAFPQITENVNNLIWNSTCKNINLCIKETSKFDVYQWIKYIRGISDDLQKRPYTDLDANCASITFQDSNKADVVTIRFKNISIKNHECALSATSDSNENHDLIHIINISYSFEEILFNITTNDDKIKDEKADEEWQTIETP